jgi:hypothetical protein
MQDIYHGIEIPQSLRDLVTRHQQHIAELVTKLRTAGMADAAIEAAVDQLIDAYRTQLIVAVKPIGGGRA